MKTKTSFLLVDDDAEDVAVFEQLLKEIDPLIELVTAADGLEALNSLQQRKHDLPDLVFLDLNMPRMDGKECLRELKKDAQLKKVPVIIYTTSSQSKDIEEALQRGAICFITKPTSLKELKHILSYIAQHVHANLEKCLRTLSNTATTFIVC